TGAYVMERYIPQQEIVLVGNPNHWRGAPKVLRIVIRPISGPAAPKLQLERGDLGVATAPHPRHHPGLKSLPGIVARTSTSVAPAYLLMNNNPAIGGPFSNLKVQQAIRHALDYDGILTIAGPGSQRLASIIPTVFPGSLDSREAVKTDRAKARQLPQEANLGQEKDALSYSTDPTLWRRPLTLVAQKGQPDLSTI